MIVLILSNQINRIYLVSFSSMKERTTSFFSRTDEILYKRGQTYIIRTRTFLYCILLLLLLLLLLFGKMY